MPTCKNCGNDFPNRITIDNKTIVLSSRKYCLTCSPIGFHNTRKLNGEPRKDQREYKCKCGEIDPSKFYGNKRSTCAKCHSEYTLKRGQEKRKKAIDHLGGKCCLCGYSTFIEAIDIHHMNPSIKDENFKSLRGWNWERIEKEIETCVALCRNCHAAVHTGNLEVPIYL